MTVLSFGDRTQGAAQPAVAPASVQVEAVRGGDARQGTPVRGGGDGDRRSGGTMKPVKREAANGGRAKVR
ncbi:hypothetical protein ACFY2W_09005 [Streptomyces sp. NPDC001262]|uniref:hypothetical protein n=1 Tax=unclassified Streptomyces TaxID=2593676 RepID=UPI0036CA5D67